MKLKKEKVPWKKMRISDIKETWRRRMLGKGEMGRRGNMREGEMGRTWRRGKFRKVHGERGE